MDLIKKIKNILIKNNFYFLKISYLAGDASSRHYFTIDHNNSVYVLMYDKDKKSLENFISVSKILNSYVTIPKIIKVFPSENILIMENFGENKYSRILNTKNRKKLYSVAIDALIQIHSYKFDSCVPNYTSKIFLEESILFFEWYMNERFYNNINELKKKFNDLFISLFKKINTLPKVFIHRDYHIDNLFFLEDRKDFFRCGWIDFQDALHGFCVYDILSLTQDARIDFPTELESEIINYYLKKFGDIYRDEFLFAYDLIAIQRHLKVLGIFSRLNKRDKKTVYLKHIPRVERLLIKNLNKDPFNDLKHLIYPLLNYEN